MTNATRWVGIDLHRRRSQVAIIDGQGELTVSRRIATDREAFTEVLGDPDDTHVALEATYGWEWLADCSRTQAVTCTSRTRSGPVRSLPRV
jgi:predicted NBD/HSP70 family sugar kinase